MGIKHAANRFLRTPIDGWDGEQWLSDITQGSLRTSNRPEANNDSSVKLRNLLTSPDRPIPPNISLIRFGAPDNVYMVGRSSSDVSGSVYSTNVALRRAYYTCTIDTFISQKATSGMNTKPIRTAIGHYACDHEYVNASAAKDLPTIKFGDALVILPKRTFVDTTHEISIGTDFYEVEATYEFSGLVYCRCVVKRTPSKDIPWEGNVQASSSARGNLAATLNLSGEINLTANLYGDLF